MKKAIVRIETDSESAFTLRNANMKHVVYDVLPLNIFVTQIEWIVCWRLQQLFHDFKANSDMTVVDIHEELSGKAITIENIAQNSAEPIVKCLNATLNWIDIQIITEKALGQKC